MSLQRLMLLHYLDWLMIFGLLVVFGFEFVALMGLFGFNFTAVILGDVPSLIFKFWLGIIFGFGVVIVSRFLGVWKKEKTEELK